MHRRAIVLGVAAAAVLAACSRQPDKAAESDAAAPPAADPAAFVRALYEPYLSEGGVVPEFRTLPWSARLRGELDAMIARSNARNEPILDFDPVIDGQDYQLSNLNVTPVFIVQDANAGARAEFTNLGVPKVVNYDLVWEGGGWRIDNMRTSEWDLRQIAAE